MGNAEDEDETEMSVHGRTVSVPSACSILSFPAIPAAFSRPTPVSGISASGSSSGGTSSSRLFISSLWEYIVLLFVLASTGVIGAYDYTDRKDETSRNHLLDILMYILTGFFFFEAAVKLVALGLFSHKHSYFRSPWNVFDFLILAVLYSLMLYD